MKWIRCHDDVPVGTTCADSDHQACVTLGFCIKAWCVDFARHLTAERAVSELKLCCKISDEEVNRGDS